jgi:protein-S-isoprenylcysteine O-methyltransferase Ste14/8-oxo-dGTP pyrophosphatase MutT (NUDIX family)
MHVKSFAYVVRTDGAVPRLLVFESLDEPGLEVPKGSLEPGEAPADGALREAREESGLSRLRLVRQLGQTVWEDERQYFWLLEASGDLPDTFEHTVTGKDGDAGFLYRFSWLELGVELERLLVQGSDAFVGELLAHYGPAERTRDGGGGAEGAIVTRSLQVGFSLLILAVILLLSSGRLGWSWAWAYIAASALILFGGGSILAIKDPELVAERTRLVREGTKPWDKTLTGLYGLAGMVTLLVCGLDQRFGWTMAFGTWPRFAGLLVFLLANSFATWAILSNTFFSATVRLQREREHRVTTEGPYRFVRHPAYAGWAVCALAAPVILDSLWGFLPAAVTVGILLVRTALEDRTLQRDLDGYREYAARVRHRLLPGIW